jgi:hypothetical protein
LSIGSASVDECGEPQLDECGLSGKLVLLLFAADQPLAPCQDAKCQTLAGAAFTKKSPFVGSAVLE